MLVYLSVRGKEERREDVEGEKGRKENEMEGREGEQKAATERKEANIESEGEFNFGSPPPPSK